MLIVLLSYQHFTTIFPASVRGQALSVGWYDLSSCCGSGLTFSVEMTVHTPSGGKILSGEKIFPGGGSDVALNCSRGITIHCWFHISSMGG